jgi:hypothetical protein
MLRGSKSNSMQIQRQERFTGDRALLAEGQWCSILGFIGSEQSCEAHAYTAPPFGRVNGILSNNER